MAGPLNSPEINKVVESVGFNYIESAIAQCNGIYPCAIDVSTPLLQSTAGTYQIPAGVYWRVAAGGQFNPATTKTLDFSLTPNSVQAQPFKIFAGAGSIAGLTVVRPEWFGTNTLYQDSLACSQTLGCLTIGGNVTYVSGTAGSPLAQGITTPGYQFIGVGQALVDSQTAPTKFVAGTGTIVTGSFHLDASGITLKNFSNDVGLVLGVTDDAVVISPNGIAYPTNYNIDVENISTLLHDVSAANHNLLIENASGVVVKNIHTYLGQDGVVFKAQHVQWNNIVGWNHSTAALYIKSDTTFGTSYDVKGSGLFTDGTAPAGSNCIVMESITNLVNNVEVHDFNCHHVKWGINFEPSSGGGFTDMVFDGGVVDGAELLAGLAGTSRVQLSHIIANNINDTFVGASDAVVIANTATQTTIDAINFTNLQQNAINNQGVSTVVGNVEFSGINPPWVGVMSTAQNTEIHNLTAPIGSSIQLTGVASGGGFTTSLLGNVGNITGSSYTAHPLGSPPSVSCSASNTGGTVTAGSYHFQLVTSTGSSTDPLAPLSSPSTETGPYTITGSTGSITCTIPLVTGATSYRLFFGTSSGGENQFITFASAGVQVQTTLPGTIGAIPTYDSTGGSTLPGANNLGHVIAGSVAADTLTVAPLTTPQQPSGTPSTIGGTIAASSYNYAQVVAVDNTGAFRTLPGPISAAVVTTGSTSSIGWTWTAVTGVGVTYQVWVCNTSACTPNYYFTTNTNSYTQALPPTSGASGVLPVANTTGSTTLHNVTIDGTCTGCGSGSGLSGMTAGQVPIAATATTITSSKALAGSGAGITTGPTSSTSGDLTRFTGTAGQIEDSGIAATNVPLLSTANIFTAAQTIPQNSYVGTSLTFAYTTTNANCVATGFPYLSTFLPTYDSATMTVTFQSAFGQSGGSITCTDWTGTVTSQAYPNTGSTQTVNMDTQFGQSGGAWTRNNGSTYTFGLPIAAPSSVTAPHIIASGTAATLSGTGGTPTCAVGTCLDMRGRLSVPSATTAAVVTFGTAYGAAPVCTVTQNGGATFFIPSWTSTTTALTITTGITLTTGEEFDYACIQ